MCSIYTYTHINKIFFSGEPVVFLSQKNEKVLFTFLKNCLEYMLKTYFKCVALYILCNRTHAFLMIKDTGFRVKQILI